MRLAAPIDKPYEAIQPSQEMLFHITNGSEDFEVRAHRLLVAGIEGLKDHRLKQKVEDSPRIRPSFPELAMHSEDRLREIT